LPDGLGEAPQSDFTGAPVTGLDPALAKELGLGDGQDSSNAAAGDWRCAVEEPGTQVRSA